MAKVAVIGFGVVGSGVVEVLDSNAGIIKKRTGEDISVKRILDTRDFPDSPFAERFTKNFDDIINDDEIVVVVEAIGGITPAYDFVKKSLMAGKSVATSNKELVAKKGAELIKIAKENNVNFMFEASVGGGIPIIRPMHQCLVGNNITKVTGILNGTSNFILTKMITENMAFQDALEMAQKLGYAESDPTADVEGIDACRKICILASLAYGKHIYPDAVHTEGVSNISSKQVAYANKAGYEIKLIAQAKALDNDMVYIIVAPMMVSHEHILSRVNGVTNAVEICGDAVDAAVHIGPGAGKLPTASAVVGDVVDCVQRENTVKTLDWEDGDNSNVADFKENELRQMVIFSGSKDAVSEVFGDVEYIDGDETVFITPVMKEKDFDEKIETLANKNGEIESTLRVMNI